MPDSHSHSHKTPAKEVAIDPREVEHNNLLDCINSSQAGAVLENVEALKKKFPGLQEAMQIPPPPEPPEALSEEPSGTKRRR